MNTMPMQNQQLQQEPQRMQISTQIAVYKTSKGLMEILDKLTPSGMETYAHIHGNGERADGSRIYSLLGLVLLDYTKGTGENTVRVTANISPDDVAYLFNQISQGKTEIELKQDKIFGSVDGEADRGIVTCVLFKRSELGSDGQPRRYPWYVGVENGTGIKAKANTGGTFIQSNSYQMDKKVGINLNDQDMFKLLYRTIRYVELWEITCGRKALMQALQYRQQYV